MSFRLVGLGIALLAGGSAGAQQIVENGVPIGANPTQNTSHVLNVAAGGDVVGAVAQVARAGGGTVNLAAGVYNITASINLGSNVTINGQGSSTVIYAPETPNAIAMIAAANGAVSNVIIENLVLDGNVPKGAFGQGGGYANSGIYLYGNNNAVSNILVKNVEIRNTGIGILMTVTNAITFDTIYVHDNNPGNFAHNAYLVGCDFVYILHSRFMHAHTGDGLHFDFSASYYQIAKSEFSNNHGEGILDQGGTNINIQDSVFSWNVNDGLNASSSNDLLTRSIASNDNGYGFNIQGGENSMDLAGFGDGAGIGFFNYSAGRFANLIVATTANRYLAILADGVTGASDTADWVTQATGYEGGALSGYSSIGAVDFNANHLSDGLLTFPSVGVVGSGVYSTTWAYSNGTMSTLSMPLTVNGASAGAIDFPPTGSWSTFSTVNVSVALQDGGNTLSVSPRPLGAPLLDYLQINTAVPSAPVAPIGLTVSAPSPYSTQLTWQTVPGAATYGIIRSGAVIAVGVTGASYTDNDILLGSSTYRYSVFASNQGGGGPASASVSITTPIDAPAGLQVTAASAGNTLTWLSANGAVSYEVLRSYVSGGPYTAVASTSQTSYADATATPNVTAYYVVEAINAAGSASRYSYQLGVLTSPPAGTFLLTPAEPTVSLAPGTGGTIGIGVSSGAGFAGTISFSASGFPGGVGNTFIPASSTTGSTLVMFVPATTSPGSYTITVSGASGTQNRSTTFRLVVPQPQTITFGPIASQPAGTTLALNASASSGLPVTLTSSTPSVCTVTGTAADLLASGTCTIVASQSGNATTSAAPSVTQSFSIVFQAQTLTFAPIESQPVGAALHLIAAASSGLPVTFTSSTAAVCTVTGNTVNLLAAGTCTLVASQSGNPSYGAAVSVIRSFTVLAQSFTLSAAESTLTEPQDSNGTDILTVTPLDGFSATVGYSLAGLPSGVTGSFSGNILQVVVGARRCQEAIH